MDSNKKIKLDEIPKKSPFKVPSTYFEDFAKKMQEHTEANPHTVIIPFMVRIRPLLYIAASVLVILSVTFVALKTGNSDSDLVAKKVDTVKVATKTVAAITVVNEKETVVTKTDENEVYIEDADDQELFDDVYEELNEDI
jgi:hypothetical protein